MTAPQRMNSFQSNHSHRHFAQALGAFGIGLGTLELLETDALSRAIGVPRSDHNVMRAMGVREVANGAAILTDALRPAWMWASRRRHNGSRNFGTGPRLANEQAKSNFGGCRSRGRAMPLDVLCSIRLSRDSKLSMARAF